MKLNQLLKFQLVYASLGILYNISSLLMNYFTGQPLASTSPLAGIIVMIIYIFFLIPGYKGNIRLYRIFMLIALISLTYNGVIKHAINGPDLELYHSFLAWFVAIFINVIGSIVNAISLIGKFKK